MADSPRAGWTSSWLANNPFTSNGQDELRSLQERVSATEEKLVAQQQLIEELTEKVKTNSSEVEDLKNSNVAVDVGEEVEYTETMAAAEISIYEFDQSMWDATLLLFVGSSSTGFTDKLILFIGVLLNLGLQVTLLVVIMCDMLDSPFDKQRVQGMLDWRVSHGHTDEAFFNTMGKSKVDRLCQLELWSFEQAEYEDIFMYLYEPIPGVVLSLLAIVLWVLTCMTEYRHIVEQFLAVLRLPTAEKDKHGKRVSSKETKDSIEVIGIRPCHRILAFIFLSLPRLGVLCVLCGVGCKYLAQTITLADIVLNAVALAFVLDVDEALCHVLLSQKLRSSLNKMQPIPCGSKACSFKGIAVKDIIRYLVTLGVIAFTVWFWLLPFHDYVVGAANALCGGKQDFTYTGGTQLTPMVTLKNTSDWASACTDELNEGYMAQFYSGLFNFTSQRRSPPTVDPEVWTQRRMQAVLSYAFKGCAAGQIIFPDGVCRATPSALMEVLPAEVTPGANVDPEQCQRLEPQRGWDTCTVLRNRSACLWTWLSHVCEGEYPVPGYHHEMACGHDLHMACEEWSHFGFDHPTRNCQAAWVCPEGQANCLAVTGSIDFTLSNGTLFRSNESVTDAAVTAGIRAGLNLTDETMLQVTVDYARRLLRRLQPGSGADSGSGGGPPDGGEDSTPPVSNSTTATATFEIVHYPDTLKTQAFMDANASILAAINTELTTSLGVSGLVTGFAWSGQPEYLSHQELQQQMLQEQMGNNGLNGLCGPGDYCLEFCDSYDYDRCLTQAGSGSPTPSPSPTPQPSVAPSHEPSPEPSPQPSVAPSHEPSPEPSPEPSEAPQRASKEALPEPSEAQTPPPAPAPSPEPSEAPSSASPEPSPEPSEAPTPSSAAPSPAGPSPEPSNESSEAPSPASPEPSPESSEMPTPSSAAPSPAGPSPEPSNESSEAPSPASPEPSTAPPGPSPESNESSEAPSASPEPSPEPSEAPAPPPPPPGQPPGR